MEPRRGIRCPALAAVGIAAQTGCAAFGPALAVPDGGSAMCSEPGQPDAIWFGASIRNLTSQPITLTDARLGEAEGAEVLEILAIPEVSTADGGTMMMGSARDLAKDAPELWAARQPLPGFLVQPGQRTSVVFHVTRAAGAKVANVATQIITHRVAGELLDRDATSIIRFTIAPDCDAIDF